MTKLGWKDMLTAALLIHFFILQIGNVFQRAVNVVRYFYEEKGIEPSKLSAAAYGAIPSY